MNYDLKSNILNHREDDRVDFVKQCHGASSFIAQNKEARRGLGCRVSASGAGGVLVGVLSSAERVVPALPTFRQGAPFEAIFKALKSASMRDKARRVILARMPLLKQSKHTFCAARGSSSISCLNALTPGPTSRIIVS